MTARMRFPLLLSFISALGACSMPLFAKSITDFGLYDQSGHFYQMSRVSSDLILLIVQQFDDPASRQAVAEAASLQQRFQDDSLFVAALNPGTNVSRDSAREEMIAIGMDLPVLLDSAQVVSSSLDVKRSGEVFLIDSQRLNLLYRGSINEAENAGGQPTLEAAIEAALTGETSTVVSSHTEGTPIHLTYRNEFESQGVSYQEDVAPIFINKCAGCHVEDGLAPWPMTNHRMLQGWSPMIREVLLTRRMPPGQIDEQVGEWTDTHQLTDFEIALLVYWIDNGARKEGDADPVAARPLAVPQWPLGEPDLVVDLPEYSVPATGIVDFVYERLDIPLVQDTWVKAVSYWPGDASVLHSVLTYAVASASPPVDPFELISAGDTEFVSLFVPGKSTDEFLPGSAFLLSKDSDLVVKVRYLSSGRATTDSTRIGLHFMDTDPEMAINTLVLENADFVIPAGKSNEIIQVASAPFETDVLVEAFAPQMHGRGVGMSITARFPDGHERQLINVPNYNFNWQMNYTLREPIQLPAGTRLLSTTVFDNSELNPFSLAPEEDAVVGPTSWDEILKHYVRIYLRTP